MKKISDTQTPYALRLMEACDRYIDHHAQRLAKFEAQFAQEVESATERFSMSEEDARQWVTEWGLPRFPMSADIAGRAEWLATATGSSEKNALRWLRGLAKPGVRQMEALAWALNDRRLLPPERALKGGNEKT